MGGIDIIIDQVNNIDELYKLIITFCYYGDVINDSRNYGPHYLKQTDEKLIETALPFIFNNDQTIKKLVHSTNDINLLREKLFLSGSSVMNKYNEQLSTLLTQDIEFLKQLTKGKTDDLMKGLKSMEKPLEVLKKLFNDPDYIKTIVPNITSLEVFLAEMQVTTRREKDIKNINIFIVDLISNKCIYTIVKDANELINYIKWWDNETQESQKNSLYFSQEDLDDEKVNKLFTKNLDIAYVVTNGNIYYYSRVNNNRRKQKMYCDNWIKEFAKNLVINSDGIAQLNEESKKMIAAEIGRIQLKTPLSPKLLFECLKAATATNWPDLLNKLSDKQRQLLVGMLKTDGAYISDHIANNMDNLIKLLNFCLPQQQLEVLKSIGDERIKKMIVNLVDLGKLIYLLEKNNGVTRLG